MGPIEEEVEREVEALSEWPFVSHVSFKIL